MFLSSTSLSTEDLPKVFHKTKVKQNYQDNYGVCESLG